MHTNNLRLVAAVAGIAVALTLFPSAPDSKQKAIGRPPQSPSSVILEADVAMSHRLPVNSEADLEDRSTTIESGKSLSDCLEQEAIGGQEAVLLCLTERLRGIEAELDAGRMVGEVVCQEKVQQGCRESLLENALQMHRNKDLLSLLDGLRGVCPGWRVDDLILSVVMGLAETDTLLFDAIRESLSPEALFDPNRGAAAIRLASFLAKNARDGDLLGILEEGAVGGLGGTTEQAWIAFEGACRVYELGSERFVLAQRVLRSTGIPLDGIATQPVGACLMAMLTSPKVCESALSSEVVMEISRLLDDDRFGKNAAAQILKHMAEEQPPPGISSEEWGQLWAHAKMITLL